MRLVFALSWALVLVVTQAAEPVQIDILYDDTSIRPDLDADWGFVVLVTTGGHRVLLDTGANDAVFMKNLKAMGVDPASIEHLVISHEHGDHTGAIAHLMRINPKFEVHKPVLNQGPFQVAPGVYSTGALPGPATKQALVLETPKGLVVITGCSHPGSSHWLRRPRDKETQTRYASSSADITYSRWMPGRFRGSSLA